MKNFLHQLTLLWSKKNLIFFWILLFSLVIIYKVYLKIWHFLKYWYFIRLDSLENPVKPPIVIYKHTNRWDKLKIGLEPADQQIVDRLRKLKDEERNIPLPTVEEIKQRLALLKDQNPEASGSNTVNVCEQSI